MSRSEFALEARETALTQLLNRHPDAVIAALADNGSRIALPESFPVDGHHALAVPAGRQTMLDVVIPADRMTAVAAWERARLLGIGVTSVHALSDPDTRLTLSLVDVRERFGVWLAVLAREGEQPATPTAWLPEPLAVCSRPHHATIRKSHTGIITGVDASAIEMLGFRPDQMLGLRSTEFIHPEDVGRALDSWMQLLSSLRTQRVRLRHRCADESWLWVEVEHIHNGAVHPDEVDVIAQISDISGEMLAREAVCRREQLFIRLAESLPAGIGVLQLGQDGAVVFSNNRLEALMRSGRPSVAADPFVNVTPGDRPRVEHAIEAALRYSADSKLEVDVDPEGTGARRRCALMIAAVAGEDGEPAALICVNEVR